MQVSVLVLFSTLAIAVAQSQDPSTPAITPRPTTWSSSPLPPCIIQCLAQAVRSSGCNVNDQACACTNQKYQDTSRSCIDLACTLDDQVSARRLQEKCSEIPVIRSTTSPPPRTPTVVMAAATSAAPNTAVENEPKGWLVAVIGALGLILAL